MDKRYIASENLKDTGFSYTLSLINEKYKMTILYTLMAILDGMCEWGDKNRI